MTAPSNSLPEAPPAPFAASAHEPWMLDRRVAFMNHGCFGARLRGVVAAQQAWRERFEARPVDVLERRRDEQLAEVKPVLGAFLGMRQDDFGFTTNATDSINAVVKSLRFEAGDELVTTSHAYNAIRLTLEHLVAGSGAKLVTADVPLPCATPEQVLDAIMAATTQRTRLAVIDHVTSPTAVRFPIEAIVSACAAKGIDVLVDGAHAPGMLDLDVEAIGAAYYAGNLHKWVGAPPGAAFLWVRPDRQTGVHPNVISHYLGEGLAPEFAWQGTRDISPWLAVKTAIEEAGVLAGPEGWPRIRRHNHELATWAQAHLCRALDVVPRTPLDGSMLGSMASLPVPDRVRQAHADPDALHDRLYDEFGIEVPIFDWDGQWLVRVSCHVYNTADQYERLALVLKELSA